MHTVVETPSYVRAASTAGLSGQERQEIVTAIASEPMLGDEIRGTGGCRKIRFSGRGKGKSGGYRVITFFTGPAMPVFLLTIFSKGERSDLGKAEQNALRKLTREIAETYKARGRPGGRR